MGKGAVVLELNSCNVTLLTDQGAFLRIPVKRLPGARYVGQHVNLAELRSPNYGRWVSVAAACLIFLLIIPLLRPTPAQAWVTLDGSSSLEVLLDHRFRVLEVRSLNTGGKQFVDDLQDGLSFSALVDSYLTWSSQNGEGMVLITATASTKAVNDVVSQRTSANVDVVVFEVDPEAREEAGKLGVSTGRALFLAGADHQGINITLEQIKESNPFAALTEAGVNVEQVVSTTSDPNTQVEKIKDLPKPDQEPGDTVNSGEPEPAPGQSGDSEDSSSPPSPPSDQTDNSSDQDGNLPPGQDKKDSPREDQDNPGDDQHIPPGQVDIETPPGQDKETPSEPDDESTPQDQETPPGQDTPPGQREESPPPGQRDRADWNEDKPPYGLKEKFKPRPSETVQSWKEEKTGPPFKEKESNGNNGGDSNNSSDGNGNNSGNGKGNNKNKP